MPPTILVQLVEDAGTEPTTSAVGPAGTHALDRAESDGGVVYAVAVVDTGRYGEPALSSAEVFVDELEAAAARRLAAFAARAKNRGIEARTRCCHGRLNERLVADAEDVGADVVVVDRRLPHGVRERLRGRDVTVERPGRTTPEPT